MENETPLEELGFPMKYDVKVCTNKIKFVSLEVKNRFKNDFDETYNIFLVKIGNLLEEYGVAKIDVGLSEFLINGLPTF